MGARCLVLGLLLFGCQDVSAPRARPEEPRLFDSRRVPTAPAAEATRVEFVAPTARLLDDTRIEWSANRVMRKLGQMAASLTDSQYQYAVQVDEKRGIYRFDCSGMTHWVLRKSAPRAAWTASQGLPQRPLARDFQRRIARAPVDRERGGWQRIARVDQLEPGDVVAWLKPKEIQSPNTGHVAFVLLPPARVPGYENAYLVRIADSTRLLHDDDTRNGRNGFGFGTILLVSDPETGAPTAYGWAGLRWRAFETAISLGRPEN
jgi:hypothetical protein